MPQNKKQLNFGDDHHQEYWQALAGSHYSQKFSPSVSFYLSMIVCKIFASANLTTGVAYLQIAQQRWA